MDSEDRHQFNENTQKIADLEARVEKLEDEKIERLKSTIRLILDQVDYTAGNCRINEMVGAVLPKEIIEKAREAVND